MGLRQVRPRIASAVIANAGTTSGVIGLEDGHTRGTITFPAAFTGATISYQVAADGTNFVALKTAAGAAFGNVTAAANAQVPLPDELFSFPAFKIVSASAEGAERVIVVRLF